MTEERAQTQQTGKEVPDPPGAVSNQNGEEAETPHRDHPEGAEESGPQPDGKNGGRRRRQRS